MGKPVRGLLAVGVAVTAAIGLAGEAAADDPAPEGTLEGVYTFNQEGNTANWRIYPLCVPTVGDARVPLHEAVGCKLQVESDGIPGQAGAYKMVSGRWTYSTPILAGKTCPDGATAASQETYQFDTSLNGTYSHAYNAVCGLQPGIEKHPFTLTYVGPLPNPVTHYPLNCQDNPQHLCS